MSDYAKIHTKQAPGKMSYSAKPTPGANKQSGKNHETDIAHAEGLGIGSVHPAHTKEQVKQAKLNPAPHKASHAQRNRALAGNADPEGCGVDVANQETGHGPLQSALKNTKVRNKAFGFNERSENGGADPSAV
jgi:hypothetical protein